MDIETERLVLRLVPLAGLAATAANDQAAARRIIGESLPEAWFDDAWVAALRLKQWAGNPAYAPWSIRAIARKDTGEIVGNVNCHHVPMPFALGGETTIAVEMGYGIFAPWRRHGYAFEALTGYMGWAAEVGVGAIILSISPGNAASRGLAFRLGATRIGSQESQADGVQDIFFARL